MAGEFKERAILEQETLLFDIAGKVEHIMDYIKGARGEESDYEILNTVDADIEALWVSLIYLNLVD